MPASVTDKHPLATRITLWVIASLLIVPALLISTWQYREATSAPARFQQIAGELQAYTLDTSGKATTKRTTLFSVAGQPGRFWTQALTHAQVEASWPSKPRQLRFYVQTNSIHRPMQGDARKTYGLWVDGQEVESLETSLKQEEGGSLLLGALSVLMYGLAITAFIAGYRATRPRGAH